MRPRRHPLRVTTTLSRRKEQNLAASRLDARSATPSIRSFAQAIDRQRASVERIPLLAAGRGDLVAAARGLDEAEVAALAFEVDDPSAELSRFAEASRAASVPILRVDLLLEEFQIYESRVAGADAVLLVAAHLSEELLVRLVSAARGTHMAACVLCAKPVDLARAAAARADVIALPLRADGSLEPSLLDAVPRRSLVLATPGGPRSLPSLSSLRGRADAALDPAIAEGVDPAASFRAALAADESSHASSL
jgi:indole-3-glycerol phosphate synthase